MPHYSVITASTPLRLPRTCRIVRPPRASHCPDCDNCVLRLQKAKVEHAPLLARQNGEVGGAINFAPLVV
eukprot:939069-Amphidinium_carterae.1